MKIEQDTKGFFCTLFFLLLALDCNVRGDKAPQYQNILAPLPPERLLDGAPRPLVHRELGPPPPWLQGPDYSSVNYYFAREILTPWVKGQKIRQGFHHHTPVFSEGRHEATGFENPRHLEGYVPLYPDYPDYDRVYGHAYGHDLLGFFRHHASPYGPFGFYANFYNE